MFKTLRSKIAPLSLALLLIIASGFLRLFLFENINHQLVYLYYHRDFSYLSDKLGFLKSFSYNDLMWIKWCLTGFFTITYLCLSCWVLKIVFNRNAYLWYTAYIFTGVVLISFLLYFGGVVFEEPVGGYRLARFCMGLVQSPLPLMILIPAFKLIENNVTVREDGNTER